MIGYLEGKLLKRDTDKILLLVNQVGYEVLLPAVVMETVQTKQIGDNLSFYIYYQQTERQPKPVLIGFNLEAEKEFFQLFITVEDIGPLKALKALSISIRDIARAIEARDVQELGRLKGVGRRTAQKIVATLEGKMGKFALICKTEQPEAPALADMQQQVMDVLVRQLGHKVSDARKMVTMALARNGAIATAEELFEEVYRGEASS